MGYIISGLLFVLVIVGLARPKLALILGAVTLVLYGALMGLGWWTLHPRIKHTSMPVSRETALKVLDAKVLPASAHDIQYYLMYMEVSPGFDTCIRFEAPLADCHALAGSILGTGKLTPTGHPSRPNNTEIPAWFAPDRISNCVTGGKGYEGQPEIWIDEDRGIFYYYLTD